MEAGNLNKCKLLTYKHVILQLEDFPMAKDFEKHIVRMPRYIFPSGATYLFHVAQRNDL